MKTFTIAAVVSLWINLGIVFAALVQLKHESIEFDQNDLQLIGSIRIQIISETGTLVVVGEHAEDVNKVTAVINKIVETARRGGHGSQMIKLKNAHAQYVAAWAQHLYDLNFRPKHGAVTITAQNQSELLILGPERAIEQAGKIVTQLDR